jgi:DNA helicase IV
MNLVMYFAIAAVSLAALSLCVRSILRSHIRQLKFISCIQNKVDEILEVYKRQLPPHTGRFTTRRKQEELGVWLTKESNRLISRIQTFIPSIRNGIKVTELENRAASHDHYCERLNEQFCTNQLSLHKGVFDSVVEYPLSDEQRSAIVQDDQYSLLVAGAGTGKTSTILGKVCWIVASKQAAPSEVLVLAFNRRAAGEARQRIEEAGYGEVEVRTFHSLGLKVHREAGEQDLNVSGLLSDNTLMQAFIQEVLRDMLDGPNAALVNRFLGLYNTPIFNETDPDNWSRYYAMRRITLCGERVRSEQERRIADWCTMHGVKYEYEKPYSWPESDKPKYSYRPDFYFPAVDSWLEHWGIDRQGRTRPGIGAKAYQKQIKDKRRLHREHGTELLETHSYDFFEGSWQDILRTQLEESGLKIPAQPIAEGITPAAFVGRLSEIAQLIERFIALFRSSYRLGTRVLEVISVSGIDQVRTSTFLQLVDEILLRYESHLKEEEAIDFAEMIHSATSLIESGDWISRFKYILVDEFQDLSRDRAGLLKQLLNAGDDVRMFGVGDDWQSINRYAGASVSLMTDFELEFGRGVQSVLTQTYRFPEEILHPSNVFVTRNPDQIQKELKANRSAGEKRIKVVADDRRRVLKAIYEFLPDQETADLLWLTRYNRTKPVAEEVAREHPKIKSYREATIHGTKGEEADFVVIGDLVSGGYSFPSVMEDDPLLSLLQPRPEAFPFAEERRLLYVALTRAKEGVILLHPTDASLSPFLTELLDEEFEEYVDVDPDLLSQVKVSCPVCTVGRIKEIEVDQDQWFWGCSSFPQCKYRPIPCPKCQESILVHQSSNTELQCLSIDCDASVPLCLQCGVGILVLRGKESFWGCSHYPSCDFTRNAEPE